MDDAARHTLRAYDAVFSSPDGRLVLDDLERCFTLRSSALVDEELEPIPHPYRGYCVLGQQILVRRIHATLEYARNPPPEVNDVPEDA